ncbi:MAG: hypothetical protein JWO39_2281 [Gemmatimonadetes bacterium]|nr:hypothetical protein [Gemmatimonadota bacterium]
MKTHSHFVMLALVTVGQFATTSARAQAADSLTKIKSEGVVVNAPAVPVDTSVHKKKGMFGKLKSVAQNKTVQAVTKAAVCNAVPGGQYMLGAAEAAKAKTSIASGAANAQGCIPGMPGAGAGMPGMGAKGALAGAAMGAAGSIGTPGLPGGVGGPNAAQAAAMQAMMRGAPGGAVPGGGAPGMPTPEQIAAMQAMVAQMQGGAMAAGAVTTEAAGQQVKLSGSVADEIKKGKLTIKQVDWIRGSPGISPSTTQGFVDLMTSVAIAMKEAGGVYRVDVYMDKKYTDQEIAALGPGRAGMIVAVLQDRGQVGQGVVAGKVGKEKEQRVEIVKQK